MGLNSSHFMRPVQGLFIPSFALAALYCPNLVTFLLVGWQSPPCKLTIASEYFARMKPLATFRATVNLISTRNKILLITPIVHILSRRRRSVLEQVGTRRRPQKVHFGLLLYPLCNHFNPLPWSGPGLPGYGLIHRSGGLLSSLIYVPSFSFKA